MVTDLSNEQSLERVLVDYRPAKEAAHELRLVRERTGLTVKQFAELLDTSEQTLYRWEKGTGPPRDKAYRYRAALTSLRGGRRGVHASAAEQNWAIRQLPYIVQRERLAERVYLLKGEREFLSAGDLTMAVNMLELVQRNKLTFHFVFPQRSAEHYRNGRPRRTSASGSPADEASAAHRSFAIFWSHAQPKLSDAEGERIRFSSINDPAQFYALGLSPHQVGIVVVVYPAQTVLNPQVRRTVDVFIEMEVAVLTDPEVNQVRPTGEPIWIELPPRLAEEYRQTIVNLLGNGIAAPEFQPHNNAGAIAKITALSRDRGRGSRRRKRQTQ